MVLRLVGGFHTLKKVTLIDSGGGKTRFPRPNKHRNDKCMLQPTTLKQLLNNWQKFTASGTYCG